MQDEGLGLAFSLKIAQGPVYRGLVAGAAYAGKDGCR
jgi:hypothetical protein